jgi:hypothetical protein
MHVAPICRYTCQGQQQYKGNPVAQIFMQHTHEPCTLAALRLWFHHLQCGPARPRGYAGLPGKAVHLEVLDQVFASEDAAAQYIYQHNARVRPAMAAQFECLVELTPAELGEQHDALLLEARAILRERQRFTQAVVRGDAAKLAAPMLACSNCGSSINRTAFLAHTGWAQTDCPVCRANLLVTPAHQAARAALELRHDEARARIDAFKVQRRIELGKDTPQLMWLVAGWCQDEQAEAAERAEQARQANHAAAVEQAAG